MPYLLKIRRYGEDTDTVRSEGEDTFEDKKIRSKTRTLSDLKEKIRIRSKRRRYGRRYEDKVEERRYQGRAANNCTSHLGAISHKSEIISITIGFA